MGSGVIGFLESPLFAVFLTLLFGVLAVSGKLSQRVAQALLGGVLVVGSLAIMRSGIQDYRPITGAILALAGSCFFVSYWIKPGAPKISPHAGSPSNSYSNLQLKEAVFDLARRLRKEQSNYEAAKKRASSDHLEHMASAANKKEQDAAFVEFAYHTQLVEIRMRADFEVLRGEAVIMKAHLLERLPPQPTEPLVEAALVPRMLASASPLADYLERLASILTVPAGAPR